MSDQDPVPVVDMTPVVPARFVDEPRFNLSFTLPAVTDSRKPWHHAPVVMRYADFGYRNAAAPATENVLLMIGPLSSSRLCYIGKEWLARQHHVRIICPDRPIVHGCHLRHNKAGAIRLVSDCIHGLLRELAIDAVHIACHDTGVIYALDLVVHHPEILHHGPITSCFFIGAPWIQPDHTDHAVARVARIARCLPLSLVSVLQLWRRYRPVKDDQHYLDDVVGSDGADEDEGLDAGHDEGNDEGSPQTVSAHQEQILETCELPKKYVKHANDAKHGTYGPGHSRVIDMAIHPLHAAFEPALMCAVHTKERDEHVGASYSAALECSMVLRKGVCHPGWSDWGDVDQLVHRLVDVLQRRHTALSVFVLYAEHDEIIGAPSTRGPEWFNAAWMQDDGRHVISYRSTVIPGADHYGIFQDCFSTMPSIVGIVERSHNPEVLAHFLRQH